MRKLLYCGFRYSHHNEGSGYDGVVSDADHYVCGNRLPLNKYPEPSRLRKLNFLLLDLVTFVKGIGYPSVHYFYPEDSAFLSPLLLKALGKRVSYTIHLDEQRWLTPTGKFFWWLKRQSLKKGVDTLITLSSQQAASLAGIFPDKRVLFIPHGLDMEAAEPDLSLLAGRFREKRLTVVGSNYRDFGVLEKVIRSRSSREVTFELVGLNEENRRRFENIEGVTCHPRLDSRCYQELLQRSFVMALPLTFATANNALLEAHKFYLPSLCSDLPGVRDYATEDTVFFRDAASFWDAFDQLSALDLEQYRALCLKTHREAKRRFSWGIIHRELALALE